MFGAEAAIWTSACLVGTCSGSGDAGQLGAGHPVLMSWGSGSVQGAPPLTPQSHRQPQPNPQHASASRACFLFFFNDSF